MPGFAVDIQPARGGRCSWDAHVVRTAGARRATERWATRPSDRRRRSRKADPRQTRLCFVVAVPAGGASIGEVRVEVEADAFGRGFPRDAALATDEPWVDLGAHDAGCWCALEAQRRPRGVGAGPFARVGNARVLLSAAPFVARKRARVVLAVGAAPLLACSDAAPAHGAPVGEGRQRALDAAAAVRTIERPAHSRSVDSAADVPAVVGNVRRDGDEVSAGFARKGALGAAAQDQARERERANLEPTSANRASHSSQEFDRVRGAPKLQPSKKGGCSVSVHASVSEPCEMSPLGASTKAEKQTRPNPTAIACLIRTDSLP